MISSDMEQRGSAQAVDRPGAVLTEEGHPLAAVLVAIYPTRYGDRVILTRRPNHLRRHAGQIAFPGGMVERSDASPYAAALREAIEEVGLTVPPSTLATPLTTVITFVGGTAIQPFLIHLPRSPRLRRSIEEVDAILRVPISFLRRPSTRQIIPHPRRPGDETIAYIWHEEVIWGATARILDEVLRRT